MDDIKEFFEKRLNVKPDREDLAALKDLLKRFSEAIELRLNLKVRIIPKEKIVEWW